MRAMSVPIPEATKEVADRHRFDVDALSRWMREHVPAGGSLPTVRQFRGGQSNPTFWLSDGVHSWVLRKKPPGALLPSAHQVEREYRVLSALAETDVPVAKVYGLCEDVSVIGTAFYVMEYVDGRVFWDVQLPGMTREERRAIYDEECRVLAAIHSVDIEAVNLQDFGRRGQYVERQIHRWTEQYRASQTETIASMEALIAYLPAHLPARDETTLVHGDYRLDNLIFHPTEPRVLAVIDWELSTLGHPLADFAYTSMMYDITMPKIGGLVNVDFAATGIPTQSELIERYCALTGRDRIDDFAYFKAFSLFRAAAILQGVYKRGLVGNASGDETAAYGAAVAHLSRIGQSVLGLG